MEGLIKMKAQDDVFVTSRNPELIKSIDRLPAV
jgi:hypothetical protein